MRIVETRVSHRKTPPGACVEFLGSGGESIEVDLRGERFAEMTDHDVIARAKATMSGAGTNGGDALRDEAGIDQTLDMP